MGFFHADRTWGFYMILLGYFLGNILDILWDCSQWFTVDMGVVENRVCPPKWPNEREIDDHSSFFLLGTILGVDRRMNL